LACRSGCIGSFWCRKKPRLEIGNNRRSRSEKRSRPFGLFVGAFEFLARVEVLSLAPGFSRVMSASVRENGFNRFL
jgi:hypothetical protein